MRVTFQGGGPADGDREVRGPLPDTIPVWDNAESEWKPDSDLSTALALHVVGIYRLRTWSSGGSAEYARHTPVYVWENSSASSGEAAE